MMDRPLDFSDLCVGAPYSHLGMTLPASEEGVAAFSSSSYPNPDEIALRDSSLSLHLTSEVLSFSCAMRFP
jgi:hypothetical protein